MGLLIHHVNKLEFIMTIIVDLITLFSIILLENRYLSQTVSAIRLSQGKEIHPIP
jgi:hypothetical protein